MFAARRCRECVCKQCAIPARRASARCRARLHTVASAPGELTVLSARLHHLLRLRHPHSELGCSSAVQVIYCSLNCSQPGRILSQAPAPTRTRTTGSKSRRRAQSRKHIGDWGAPRCRCSTVKMPVPFETLLPYAIMIGVRTMPGPPSARSTAAHI